MKNYDFISYRAEGWDARNDRMHVHNGSYEILQVVSGSGYFVIGGTPYPMSQGSICFTNSVQLHCSRPDDTSCYVRSKLGVKADYFDEVLRVLGLENLAKDMFGTNGGCCVTLPPAAVSEVDKCFRKMAELYSKEENDVNAKVTVLLVQILLTCADLRSPEDTVASREDTLITRAVNYINDNISSELTIEMIAKENFVSKYHLCRSFKRALGVSIMKYILSQRVTLAKEQLIHTDASCSDIAMTMGFSSFSYFCRVFKQQEGITPNQYRRIYGNAKKRNNEQRE